MTPFYVMIKCQLGKTYQVANAIADAEIASETYSISGEMDLMVKIYLEEGQDIGHFVSKQLHCIDGIQDTRTIITFKAF
ncbi:Lrp/AsnC ligand binding domain-containing protein [Flexibacterium corallicola]|uniref:Lrp/AsnC ligand binding domain-containing protein n=1 Tax=Flexibacterium corallicola TaxID=3037259 RepID=UPI00286EB880|nr:Lrp/AsnC ligand binding domain-containing protein [Pseudovibrio sp. M1P-2-3]